MTLAPFFADFADGQSALLRRVEVHHGPGTELRILLPEAPPIHWPLAGLRALPDISTPGTLVLSLEGGGPARLYVQTAEPAQALRALCPRLGRTRWPSRLLARLGVLAAGAVASVAVIVLALIPLMANQLAMLLPPRGEQALGAATFEQIRAALGQGAGPVPVCTRLEGREALDRMTHRLLPEADLPYPLDVQVLNHPMINAFALPGGKVILFRGLISAADTPEQLAGVLAHEIGHVTARDPTRLALRSAGSVGVLGLLFGDFAGGAVILLATEHLIRASHSRRAEAAADLFALEMLARAGLPSTPFAEFFLAIAEDSPDSGGLVAHFASHPDPRGRAATARAADTVDKRTFEPVLDDAQWTALRAICRR
ncbi:MAG: M48 family metallopeptidase [Rhodobacteraceae bacterium]|nr:M48 family metallopeptidase [Paracoccaceae bacterium]